MQKENEENAKKKMEEKFNEPKHKREIVKLVESHANDFRKAKKKTQKLQPCDQ